MFKFNEGFAIPIQVFVFFNSIIDRIVLQIESYMIMNLDYPLIYREVIQNPGA